MIRGREREGERGRCEGRLLGLTGKRKGPEIVEHEGTARAYDQWGRNAVPRVCDMLGVPGVDKVGFCVWHCSHTRARAV
jgi:hypothetical protein